MAVFSSEHPRPIPKGRRAVIEGVNILEGREILSAEVGTSGPNMTTAQAAPTPDVWGAVPTNGALGNLSSMFGQAMGTGMYMPRLNLLEVPGMQKDAQQRSGAEANQQSNEQAKVEIVCGDGSRRKVAYGDRR